MKKKVKRELIEWIVLIAVFGIIYLGGWHTEVIGKVQQVVLATGIISPSSPDEKKFADYEFRLEDLNGNKVSFSEFKGKSVFLNFWATWCPPCVAEMPDIHSLYKKTGDKISFVMISIYKVLHQIHQSDSFYASYFLF